MRQDNTYKKTIETYKKLGKEYLKSIKKLTFKQLADFMKILPAGGEVLDVGCAGGRDSREFVKNGFRVVGIDLVDDFLEEAKRNVPEARFIKMDLLKLKFDKNSFDGIWASAILVHIKRKDIKKALLGFHRILKPQGKLFVAVKIGKGSSSNVLDKLSQEKRFFTYFSSSEMKKLLGSAGFKIEKSWIAEDGARRKDVKWVRIIASKM